MQDQISRRLGSVEDDVREQRKALADFAGVPSLVEDLKAQNGKIFTLIDETKTLLTNVRIDLATKQTAKECGDIHKALGKEIAELPAKAGKNGSIPIKVIIETIRIVATILGALLGIKLVS